MKNIQHIDFRHKVLQSTMKHFIIDFEYLTYIWVIFPRTGKVVKMWIFFIFWSSAVTKWFDFLNCSEEILLGGSKNVVVWVLAHLEPEL